MRVCVGECGDEGMCVGECGDEGMCVGGCGDEGMCVGGYEGGVCVRVCVGRGMRGGVCVRGWGECMRRGCDGCGCGRGMKERV